MSGPVTITDNTAFFGGAIWTKATKLTIPGDADISSNIAIVAVRFDGMHFRLSSTLLLPPLARGRREETLLPMAQAIRSAISRASQGGNDFTIAVSTSMRMRWRKDGWPRTC